MAINQPRHDKLAIRINNYLSLKFNIRTYVSEPISFDGYVYGFRSSVSYPIYNAGIAN